MTTMTLKRMLLSLLLIVALGNLTRADVYPSRVIKIVAPFSPGGGDDFLARLLASRFEKSMGQPVVVVNRPGAGSIIGMDYVAKADPDGYTIAVEADQMSTLDALYAHVPFDVLTGFAPIGLIAKSPTMIAASPSVPAKTFGEFITWAKKQGRLNFTSCGVGTPQYLAGELLKMKAHIKMVHVAYNGCGPAMVAAVSGQVPIIIGTEGGLDSLIGAGNLRGYAVTSSERSLFAPNIPTVAESGYPGLVMDGWFGLVAPAKTPLDVITKLDAELNKALKDPSVRKLLASQGYEPLGGTPVQFSQVLRTDHDTRVKLIHDIGIKP